MIKRICQKNGTVKNTITYNKLSTYHTLNHSISIIGTKFNIHRFNQKETSKGRERDGFDPACPMSLLEIYQGIFSIHILTLVQSVQIFTQPFKKNKTLLKTKGSGECLKMLRLYYNIIPLLINKKRRITVSKDPKSSSLATSPFINFNQHYPHNHLHVWTRFHFN